MSTQALETQILDFLDATTGPQDVGAIVRQFRGAADEATIKAALLSLNVTGFLDITPDWEFFRPTTISYE